MELKQLRYFLAVAEEESFSRAAKRMNMSQPPLSMQIQKLENELGVSLFIRGKRKISLTPAGSALIINAKRLLESEARIADDVRNAASGQGGRLLVGLTDDYLFDLVPKALAELHARYPTLLIESTRDLSFDLAHAVSQRRLDVAFLCPPVSMVGPRFQVEELSPAPIEVVVSATHPLARKTDVSLEEIWQYPFIWPVIREQTGYMLELLKIVRRMGGFPNIVHRANSTEVAYELVAYGVGVAPLGKHSAADRDDIIRLPIDGVSVNRAAIWCADSPSELVNELIDLVRENGGSGRK
ncbi:MAG: LysR family transcriptional regulator [Pseudomonadota bacterium]